MPSSRTSTTAKKEKDNILSSSYLKCGKGKGENKELQQKLRNLHQLLSESSQEEEEEKGGQHKKIKVVAGQLISENLLNHADKEIRVLVCCCIVDILRIFVPESPFSAEELCLVFNKIATLLRGFETHVVTSSNSFGGRLLYILKSLSTVRSSVLMVYLTQQAVPGAFDALKSVFNSLISSIRQDHDDEVASHMGSVLQACIEETFDLGTSAGQVSCFDQDLLDTLLLPLLPSARQENPAAYALCQSVLTQTSSLLQNQISQFANLVLVGSLTESSRFGDESDDEMEEESYKTKSKGAFATSASELSEHIYSLIYELHKISPPLLLRILPNVCVQLQAEEVSTRLRAVKLLGRLFASPLANYAHDYKKNFKEFLGRFVDVSADVRKEMIECGFMIMKHKANVTTVLVDVEDYLCQRLRDTEWEVRYQALARLLDLIVEEHGVTGPLNEVGVTSLSTATTEGPGSTTIKRDRRGFTLREMAERMKDKRLQIRKVAMIGLAKVYWKHCSTRLDPIIVPILNMKMKMTRKSESDEFESVHDYGSGISVDVWSRLRFIPGFILSCWGYPDPEEKQLVLQLIQEQIIPKPPKKVLVSTSEKKNTSLEREESWLWERRRTAALLTMYQSLDNTQKQCLSSIFAHKAKTRLEMSSFLTKWNHQLHQPATGGGKKKPIVANPVLHRATLRLLTYFPAAGGGGSSANQVKKHESKSSVVDLESLFSFKDKSIRRLMLQAIDIRLPLPSSRLSNVHNSHKSSPEITRACEARDDLKARLDSKSPLAQYMGSLYDASACFMLLNPLTLDILLSYVTGLCQQLDKHEALVNRTSGRATSAAVKVAKTSISRLQDEVAVVCQLLVAVGKHSPRSFSEVSTSLEAWLASVCESSSSVGLPIKSLWRDATLSYFFQLVKSIKLHLYSGEIEDALEMKMKEAGDALEGDVHLACRTAYNCSLSRLCLRLVRYAICAGEGQCQGEVVTFADHLQREVNEDMMMRTRSSCSDMTQGDDKDDFVEFNGKMIVGLFSDPSLACSLLAEAAAAIVEGLSCGDMDNRENHTSSSTSSFQLLHESILRKRYVCEMLGMSMALRYLLSSLMNQPKGTGTGTPNKQKSRRSSSSSSSSISKVLHGDYDSLPLHSLSSRLCVIAALLQTYEDKEMINHSDIVSQAEESLRSDSSVLVMALSLVKRSLLGSGKGVNCGEFPANTRVKNYLSESLTKEERRVTSVLSRQNDETTAEVSNGYLHTIMRAVKVYTALTMHLDILHDRKDHETTTDSKKKKGSRKSQSTGNKQKNAVGAVLTSSPFKERLEEEYEVTIDEVEDPHNSSQSSSLEERFPSYLADLMTYLLSIIRSRGVYLDKKRAIIVGEGKGTAQAEDAALLRETAGKCFLQLLTLKRVNKSLQPKEWLTVSTLLLDTSSSCRQNVCSKLCTLMQTHCLHPRFLALPCLAVLPVSSEVPSATASLFRMTTLIQNGLLFALKRLRCTHESLCAQVMSLSASMDAPGVNKEQLSQLENNAKKLQRTAEDNTPEGIFPYVLYLLSRPPAFPDGNMHTDVGKSQLDGLTRSLKMIIGVLVKSLRNSSGDNIALLLKQVDVVARFYQDRLIGQEELTTTTRQPPEGKTLSSYDRLQIVAELAQQTLTSMIRTQENIQPYLGDVNLPMDLYELRSETNASNHHPGHHRKLIESVFPGASVTAKKRLMVSPSKTRAKEAPAEKTTNKTAPPSKKRKKSSHHSGRVDVTETSVRRTGSRSRGGKAVNYRDTRESDDEEEMEEFEELLSSQSQSKKSQHVQEGRRSSTTSARSGGVPAPLLPSHRGGTLNVQDDLRDLEEDVDLDTAHPSSSSLNKRKAPRGKVGNITSSSSESELSDESGLDSDKERVSPAKKQKLGKKAAVVVKKKQQVLQRRRSNLSR